MGTPFSITDVYSAAINDHPEALDDYLGRPSDCNDLLKHHLSSTAWDHHLSSLIVGAVREHNTSVLATLLKHTPRSMVLDSALCLAMEKGFDDVAIQLIDHPNEFWCSSTAVGICLYMDNANVLTHMIGRGFVFDESNHYKMEQTLWAGQGSCLELIVQSFPDLRPMLLRWARYDERWEMDKIDMVYDFDMVQDALDEWNSKSSNAHLEFGTPLFMAVHERETLKRGVSHHIEDKHKGSFRKM